MKILEPTTDPPTVTYWEDLETEILESSLRAEEMPRLLAIVSVAKHSLRYWTNAITNPQNPWFGVSGIQIHDTAKHDYTIMGIGSTYSGIVLIYHLATGEHFTRDETWGVLRTLMLVALVAGIGSANVAYNP